MKQIVKKTRVLFLFAHLHKGGMQRAFSNISLALPNDIEQFVGFFGTENPGFEYNATIKDFELSGSLNTGFVKKITNAMLRLKAVRSFVFLNNIDIVVSIGDTANVYNLLSLNKAKKIITSRVALNESLNKHNIYNWLHKTFIRISYPFAETLVAVSEDLAGSMKNIVRSTLKVVAIPNLYHTEIVRNLSKEALPEKIEYLEKSKFILNVGSLTYQKGQDDLITLFAQVADRYDELFLVILGRGEWKERLLEQSISLGIENKVVFVDFDINPYRYMARATVFVMPSRFEGFPNALVEAMICGSPAVAFDCPTGPSEILGDSEYGLLIKERSLDGAKSAICALLDDDLLNKKFRQLSLARGNQYSAENIISQWVALFRVVNKS